MADKSIEQLNAAEQVYSSDLFVLQQSGAAKKLPGQVLLNWLTAAADGHGGIKNVVKVSTSGLVDTYRMTLADTTTVDFTVTNGRAIDSVEQTSVAGLTRTYTIDFNSGQPVTFTVTDGRSITGIKKVGTSGLVDTYQISYNEGEPDTITVTNGAKGDKGDNAYTWVKYASQEPTDESHSMGDIADEWRGEYTGPLPEPPADWKLYKWYKIKGDKGETGDPAILTGSSTAYMVSDSGTIIPSGSWEATVPNVPQGKYLWTRVITTFNSGDPVTSYSVSRMGIDGTGAVNTVNDQSPDSNGNVKLAAENIATSDGRSIQAGLDETVKSVNTKSPDGAGAITLSAADVGAVSANDALSYEEIAASTDLSGKVAAASAILSCQKKLRTGHFVVKATAETMVKYSSADQILSGTLPPQTWDMVAYPVGFSSIVDTGIGIANDGGRVCVKPTISQGQVNIAWLAWI